MEREAVAGDDDVFSGDAAAAGKGTARTFHIVVDLIFSGVMDHPKCFALVGDMYAHRIAFFPKVRGSAKLGGADHFSVRDKGNEGEARGIAGERF